MKNCKERTTTIDFSEVSWSLLGFSNLGIEITGQTVDRKVLKINFALLSWNAFFMCFRVSQFTKCLPLQGQQAHVNKSHKNQQVTIHSSLDREVTLPQEAELQRVDGDANAAACEHL